MGALTLKTFPFEIRGWDIEVSSKDYDALNDYPYQNKYCFIYFDNDKNDFFNFVQIIKNNWFNHKKIMDYYLIFQYKVCDTNTSIFTIFYSKLFLSCLLLSIIFNFPLFIIIYISSMFYALVTVILGKLFPEFIGVPLTAFYKKYSTQEVFNQYCGNPLSSIVGGVVKIANTGSGKIVFCTLGAIGVQEGLHKACVGQYPKYRFEEWANNGKHPSGKSFEFKDNGPSWADNISKWGNNNK